MVFDLQRSSSAALAAYNTIWGSPKAWPLWIDYQPTVADLKFSVCIFWDNCIRSAYFDVCVFNSFAPSNSKSSTKAYYRRHEKEKRREYERRTLEVEHRTFTPLVMSTSGGWGPSATVAFRRLAGLIAAKQGQSYSRTLQFIRCKILYSLIDSASMCLRGPDPPTMPPQRTLALVRTQWTSSGERSG